MADGIRHQWTPERARAFLDALGQGLTAAASGFSRSYLYQLKDADRAFSKAWEDAGADLLEDEARRRAVEGVLEPVFYRGDECGTVRKYSDALLMFLLRARRPGRFRENSKVEMTVKGDTVAEILDAARRRAGLRREAGEEAAP